MKKESARLAYKYEAWDRPIFQSTADYVILPEVILEPGLQLLGFLLDP